MAAADPPLAPAVAAVVMVISSPEAEAVCQKAVGATVIELLNMFASVSDPAIAVQTVGEPYRVRQFTFRFEQPEAIRPTPPEKADTRLMQLLERFADLPANGPEAPLAPWLDGLREALDVSLRYAEHNGYDYPVACLLVASASQRQLARVFNSLYESAAFPSVLQDGLADPILARAYLLLNDLSEPVGSHKAEQAMRELRAAYGSSACQMLNLNDPAGGQPPGAAYVAGPLTKLVAVHMQGRVQQLAATVKEKRQGLKNTLRSWLGGKKGASDGAVSAVAGSAREHYGQRYSASSIESYLRQLAEYALLLRDPQTALGFYREAAVEYKRDKSWMHYASAQEMIAICLMSADSSKRSDVDEALEKASVHYLRASMTTGDAAARCATRVALSQHAWLRRQPTKPRSRDVADSLVNQSTHETNLVAALLLEQAARTFSSVRGAQMIRKFSFYLILAGYRYVSCGQRKHAVRAYRAALREYAGRGWTHIEDHVHFSLARNCAQLGLIEQSLSHFVQLLGHSRQPPERQQTFARELFAILRAHPRTEPLPDLTLPRFDNRSIRVILNDHIQPARGADSTVLSGEHPLWKALVRPLLPPAEANTSNWLTGRTAGPAQPTAPSPGVVDEWIYLEIELRNPSHLQLELSMLQLQCEHLVDSAGAAAGAGATSVAEGDKSLELDSRQLVLPAGQQSVLRLGVCPRREGELRIMGVTWLMQSLVRGEHQVQLHGRRLNATKKQRMGKEYEFRQSLTMPVICRMPLLQASIESLPESLMLGELRCATLCLSNVGGTPLTGLRMRKSHPAFIFVCGASEEPAADQLGAKLGARAAMEPVLVQRQGSAASTTTMQATDLSIFAIELPDGALQPGQSVRLPLWVRAAELGQHTLHIVFCYESTPPTPKMKRRLSPLSCALKVLPSLELSHFLRPARGSDGGFVLGLHLLNHSSAQHLQVSQLSCVSAGWQLAPLCEGSRRPERIAPGDECSLHLRLRRILSAETPSRNEDASMVHSELCYGPHAVDSREVPRIDFLLRDGIPAVVANDGEAASRYGVPPVRKKLTGAEVEPNPLDQPVSILVHWVAERTLATDASENGPTVELSGQLQLRNLRPLVRLDADASRASKAASMRRPTRSNSATSLTGAAISASPPTPAMLESLGSGGAAALQIGIECASAVDHDFRACELCVLPVTLLLRNCCSDSSVAFNFDAVTVAEEHGPAKGDEDCEAPSLCQGGGHFTWLGNTSLSMQWLEPGAHTKLHLSAGITAAGLYVLSGLHVSICALRPIRSAAELQPDVPIACASPSKPVSVLLSTSAPQPSYPKTGLPC